MDNETLKKQSPITTFEEKVEDVGAFAAFISFLRRFIVLIVICTVLGTALGLGVAFVKDKKVYKQSKSVVVIASIDGKAMTTNISLTKKWMSSIPTIIKTPIFIDKANAEYGGSGSDKISSLSIGVSANDNMIFTISYSDYDKDVAEKKLNAYIKAVEQEITNGYITADNVAFTDIDNVPKTSESNGFVKYVLLGIIGGLVVGAAIAFLIYLFDSTVSSKSELERLTGVTVVAYIDDVAQ